MLKINQHITTMRSNLRRNAWSKEEHVLFMQGVKEYGNSWKTVAEVVRSRTGQQCKKDFQGLRGQ